MLASATEVEVELHVPDDVSTFFGVTWAQDPRKDKVCAEKHEHSCNAGFTQFSTARARSAATRSVCRTSGCCTYASSLGFAVTSACLRLYTMLQSTAFRRFDFQRAGCNS